MASTAVDLRFRRIGRGAFMGGVLLTAIIHVALGALVWFAHAQEAAAPEVTRDLMVTRLVTLGKPREKFWLPRIQTPPRPKAPEATIKVADNPNAPPAPKTAPRPEDAEVSRDLKRALERARVLSQQAEDPPEGSLTGSEFGTSSQASAGDEYATAIFEAIRRNWTVPTGLSLGAVTGLTAEIRVSIAADGTLVGPRLSRSSGNELFDASCVQAIAATQRVPPPPAAVRARFGRGTLLEFFGKELAR